MNVLKKNKGFTLVELIVVIAIIGILAAVLIPSITSYIDKARISSAEQEAKIIFNYYNNYLYAVETGEYAEGEFLDRIEGSGQDAVLIRGYYYTYSNGKELDENTWFASDTEESITIDNKEYKYYYMYRSSSGYRVFMDLDGRIVITTE